MKEGEVGSIGTCNVFQVGGDQLDPGRITEVEIRELLLGYLER